MNWHFNVNPEKDGMYILVADINSYVGFSYRGEFNYTVRGGWNTHYDSHGMFHGDNSIGTENLGGYAWTTWEEFNAFMKEEIESALEAAKG